MVLIKMFPGSHLFAVPNYNLNNIQKMDYNYYNSLFDFGQHSRSIFVSSIFHFYATYMSLNDKLLSNYKTHISFQNQRYTRT